jgi:hypothetical protein
MNQSTSPSPSDPRSKSRLVTAILVLACAGSLLYNYLQAKRSAALRHQLDAILVEKEAQVGEADPAAELARVRLERDRLQQQLGALQSQTLTSTPPAAATATDAGKPANIAIGSGGERTRLSALPGAKVTIDGTSTIHAWTVEGAIIGGFFEADAALVKVLAGKTSEPSAIPLNVRAEAVIPIRSLKSKFTKMDEIMQEAMRMKENPRIQYWLTEMKPKAGATNAPGVQTFQTQGRLAVSGVTNTIDMDVTLKAEEGSRIRVFGSKQIKMTDFKIPPPAPSLAGGAIKTGDEVTVRFEWLLGPK